MIAAKTQLPAIGFCRNDDLLRRGSVTHDINSFSGSICKLGSLFFRVGPKKTIFEVGAQNNPKKSIHFKGHLQVFFRITYILPPKTPYILKAIYRGYTYLDQPATKRIGVS